MKMVAEYLEKAHEFERFAEFEPDAKIKAELLVQAEAYRELAAKRAKDQGLPFPAAITERK